MVTLPKGAKFEDIFPSGVPAFITMLEKCQEKITALMLIQPSMLSGKSYTTQGYRTDGLVPVEEAGVRLGSVTGYRLWRTDGHRLFSWGVDNNMWLPGVPMIGDPDKGSIIFNSKQGVYAFSTYEKLMKEVELRGLLSTWRTNLELLDMIPILGTVKMWGRIIEHEFGYRAEFARITALKAAPPRFDLAALRVLYLERSYPECTSLVPVVDEHRLRGVTTIQFGRDTREFYVLERLPPTVQKIESTTTQAPTTHRYRLGNVWRTRDGRTRDGRNVRGVLLDKDQDPKHLPGWLPLC
jgi:hypothetical protein